MALSLALIPVLGVLLQGVNAFAAPTAAIIATSGQTINYPVNATGFDVGIYVGPDVHDVTITGAKVSGANFIGILVQDAKDIVIKNSKITGNGVSPSIGSNTEYKGIVLAGTKNCVVAGNTVNNNLHGGISVLDDGPVQPFYVAGITSVPTPASENAIISNIVKDNLGDCGIVVSGKNADAGVSDTVVWNNSVIGSNPKDPGTKPALGGIVVATGFVAPSTVKGTRSS